MYTLRKKRYHSSWIFGIFCAFFIVTMPAIAAQKKPFKPYTPADRIFEACKSLTGANLANCCSERATLCNSECSELRDNPDSWPNGPGGLVTCWWDCDDGKNRCNEGKEKKNRIAWPGEDHLPIPGVFMDDSRIATDDGIGLSISTDTAIFEVRRDGAERGQAACVAIVASCNCPKELEYDTTDKECRPTLDSGVVECSFRSTGESSEDWKPCEDCLPVVLSAQPCASMEFGIDDASKSTP